MLLRLYFSLFLFVISAFFFFLKLHWLYPLSPCEVEKSSFKSAQQLCHQKSKEVLSHQPQVEQFWRNVFGSSIITWLLGFHEVRWRTEGHYSWSSPGFLTSHQPRGVTMLTRKWRKAVLKRRDRSISDKSSPSISSCFSIHLLVLQDSFSILTEAL